VDRSCPAIKAVYNLELMSTIRILHVGLGPVGASIVKQISTRAGLKSVAAVDVDPSKVGMDLGDVVGLTKRVGVTVSGEVGKTLKTSKADLVVLCTGSSIKAVMPQIEALLAAKVPIVSTAEELSYPSYTHVRYARKIDALAKKARVAVLGTGVNPGFVMDALPIMLTAACARVDRITVRRVQDARSRRLPFQQKIGAGLTTEQFQKQVTDGTVRHVGFTESIAMIADALGWTLDRITDDIQPKLATVTISSEFLAVDPGYVCGIVQDGVGYRKGEAAIRLHMEAYLGAPESYDAIQIEGAPPLSMRMLGGIHGDVATASMVVNAIPKVLAASPGLHTMRDLPLPSFFAGR
jgi:4-hydroxy-tetrahydrodipicolinate reductase